MKVIVLNFSGNVGKTTIARYLLSPRMNNAPIIPVETINSDGSDTEMIRGKQFGDVLEATLVMDDVVIDVGASNVDDVISLMEQYKGCHEDFDYFVVPTVPKNKQQRDTINILDALSNIGVPSKKIFTIFNMVDRGENIERVFSGIFKYQNDSGSFLINKKAIIHINDIYSKLTMLNIGIDEVLNDRTDYKQIIKESTDQTEKLHAAQMIAIKRLATGVYDELNEVFNALFK